MASTETQNTIAPGGTPRQRESAGVKAGVPRVAHALPDEPLIVGRPGGGWVALDLRGLWAYRELLYFLTWRDVQVRYSQTLFGAAWVVIQPLSIALVFTIFFGQLVGAPGGIPYPLFVYTGLLPWTFFANAVTNSSNSLVNSADLIRKVYFPRIIVPAAAVAAGLVDLAVAALVLVGMTLYYGIAPSPGGLLMLPLLVAVMTLLALGLGLAVSALGAKYRDIRHALPFILSLWMFSSSIFYPAEMVAARWRWLLKLNPMAALIENFRAALTGRALDWPALGIAAAIIAALLVLSAYAFRRVERSFADFI